MVHETTERDPERIYLEPWPYSPEGRLWSAENIWPLELWPPEPEDESPRALGVEYIRADLHAAEIARLTRELEEARALLRELTGHEPVLDDERLRYVEIQVNREAWEAARSAVCAHPSDRSESDE